MVFASFEFIYLFLPITLAGFFFLGKKSQSWAATWLLLASFIFYGSWNYYYILILVASILGNYINYRVMKRFPESRRKFYLIGAVTVNILLLAYFKYVNFFIESVNFITDKDIQHLSVILPIGISFFTFTQIAFLVDSFHGKTREVGFIEYVLFASFFPCIIAGPVLNHKEILPQFADKENYIPRANNFAVGITLFSFGLAKKILIADNLVPIVDTCLTGNTPSLLHAWLGIFSYSFQLYFDFSGYSDMAIGVARMMGFQIPFNFDSPYKAMSISEFWLRWHISLSRFLRNYLYIPLGGNRFGQIRRYRNLILTMILGGLWHGANWTFVIWGGLHGMYLCIHHGWAFVQGKTNESPTLLVRFFNGALTFFAVMLAWCFFRATNITMAMNTIKGMIGLNGTSLVSDISLWQLTLVAISALIAFCMPNTNEIFLHFESRHPNPLQSFSVFSLKWEPNLKWGILTGIIITVCMLSMERTSDFIYAQF